MNYLKKLSVAICTLFLINACSENLLDSDLSDEEIRICNDCMANRIEDRSLLKENLIGNWRVYAYSCMGCLEEISESNFPNISIEFFPDGRAITSYNEDSHEVTWDIVVLMDSTLMLDVEPDNNTYDRLNVFCSDYMFREGQNGKTIFRKE